MNIREKTLQSDWLRKVLALANDDVLKNGDKATYLQGL